MSTGEGDPAFFKDPRILYSKYRQFFPRSEQSVTEKTNALVRLIVYSSVAVFAYNRDLRVVVIATVLVVLLGIGLMAGTSAAVLREQGRGQAAASLTSPSLGSGAASAKKCANMSTPNNPFGNPLLTELGDASRPMMCDTSDESVRATIEKNFNKGLFRNATDIWGGGIAGRQFTTLPSTNPLGPDTVAFGKWLYGRGGKRTCKEAGENCTGND